MTTTDKTSTQYTIYCRVGWHGGGEDPIVEITDDEEYAALRTGQRFPLPGGWTGPGCYALDDEGEELAGAKSYMCEECDTLTRWGDGPRGTMGGRELECAAAEECHRVTWMCDECADLLDDDDDDDEWSESKRSGTSGYPHCPDDEEDR